MKSTVVALLLTASAWVMPAFAAMPTHPTLNVPTIDGKSFDLSAQKGHWVIVNFWATWCAPCVKELPDISQFVAKHPNVRAIGIAYQDGDVSDITNFLRDHPIVYPVAQVTMDKPLKDFDEPLGLPMTYLIAPDGTVSKPFTGPITTASLTAAISKGK